MSCGHIASETWELNLLRHISSHFLSRSRSLPPLAPSDSQATPFLCFSLKGASCLPAPLPLLLLPCCDSSFLFPPSLCRFLFSANLRFFSSFLSQLLLVILSIVIVIITSSYHHIISLLLFVSSSSSPSSPSFTFSSSALSPPLSSPAPPTEKRQGPSLRQVM